METASQSVRALLKSSPPKFSPNNIALKDFKNPQLTQEIDSVSGVDNSLSGQSTEDELQHIELAIKTSY